MSYPMLIEAGTATTAFGVIVPDLPGCFSAGDTLVEAIANAQEAIAVWIEAELEAGRSVPLRRASAIADSVQRQAGWTWVAA